jgi:ubiquinone/menaquinone biosynthesis C-methylase UbiE
MTIDVGCGDGSNPISHLASVGVDKDFSKCLAFTFNTGTLAVCADACFLPFKNGCASRVVSCQVIEHVQDDRGMVREMLRVLAVNGHLYVTSVVKPYIGWYFYKNKAGERVLDPTHVREYESEQAFRLLFPLSTIAWSKPLVYDLWSSLRRWIGSVSLRIIGYRKVFAFVVKGGKPDELSTD